MSEIADFIEVQYRRIEEKAREASTRSAAWAVNGTWHLEGVEHDVVGEEEAFCHPHNVEHIALHDPAYVLADIASKRRIIDEVVDEATSLDMSVDNDRRVGPRDEASEPYLGDILLRLLAAPFSDEPGYDAERWGV